MTAPGITVAAASTPPPVTAADPTGTWFVTGICPRGPVGRPVELRSMSDYALRCGPRSGGQSLYDALDLFFRDGGVHAFVSRVVGPAATVATLALKDGAATPVTTLNVSAGGAGLAPGAWANGATGGLSVQVVAGAAANTRQLVVQLGGVAVEQSPDLYSPADAAAWSSLSNYVTIVDAGSATTAPNNLPAVAAAAPLAGGADDNANVTEAGWTAALAAFPPDLGTGQVSAPGRTTDAAHVALMTHAAAANRTALCDAVDSPTASVLVTAAQGSAPAGLDGSRGTLCAPWLRIPGVGAAGPIPVPDRFAPPSALYAARCSVGDRASGHPNYMPCGPVDGASSYATGVTQTYTDTDRGLLNQAGVSVVRSMSGVVQCYGFRSLTRDPQWIQLNWGRLRMAIQDQGQRIAANTAEFATLDAGGKLLASLNGHLGGMLQRFWQIGALYGANATDAYAVDTSAAVNTLQTMQAGQVLAVLSIKRSSAAEFTSITIVNVPLTQVV